MTPHHFIRLPGILAAALCWLLQLFCCRAQEKVVTAAEIAQGFRSDRLIVWLRSSAAPAAANFRLLRRTFDSRSGGAIVEVRELPTGKNLSETLIELRNTPEVIHVEPDFIVRLKPLANTSLISTEGDKNCLVRSAANHAGDASGVVVAVIDTGVLLNHPSLQKNLWKNPRETASTAARGQDDDRNGYIDDLHGIDATVARDHSGSGNPEDQHRYRHGTAVAGIIGATGDENGGVVGVAQAVQIMPLRAFGEFREVEGQKISESSISVVVECIDYAIANGAEIINASYGQRFFSWYEFAALQRARAKGIILVAAADNEHRNNDVFPEYPASYPLDNIVAVTGVSNEGTLNRSWGSGRIDLAALAELVPSCLGNPRTGTSFAAPQVTGALALLKQQFPADTYRQRINRLLRSAQRPCEEPYAGKLAANGLLDVSAARATMDATPINDMLGNAIRLEGGYVVARASNLGATREAAEGRFMEAGLGATLWWAWDAPKSGEFIISTEGSEFDASAMLFAGDSSDNLIRAVPLDVAPNQRTSTYRVQANACYRIAVGSRSMPGGIVLTLGSRPENDRRANAAWIEGSTTGHNRLATADDDDLATTPRYHGRSVWYRWCAPQDGHFKFTLTSTDFAAAMVMLKPAEADGKLLKIDSDRCAGKSHAEVHAEASAGTVYYLMIDSEDEGVGTFELQLFSPK